MSTRWPGAVVHGAGISGCLAALSLRTVLDDVEIVDGSRRGTRIDFAMTIGPGLVRQLRDLGLGDAWDAWGGKALLNMQWSAWGTPILEREVAMIPREPRYLVRRSGLERFLLTSALERGARVSLEPAHGPPPSGFLLVDASGRSGQVARRRGAKRRTVGRLVALHGASECSRLPDHSIAVQSAADGWWVATRGLGRASVTYLSSHDALSAHRRDRRHRVPAQPKAFGMLVGATDYVRGASLASMSWLEAPSATNWFAVGDAALALDPIQGSGVEVASQTTRLLCEAVVARDPHRSYHEAMDRLVARHRVARQRVYLRAASAHGGAFWAQQLRL